MTRRLVLALALCVLAAAPVQAQPREWTLRVQLPGRPADSVRVWDYEAPARYKATLYAIGPYPVTDRSLPVVARFADIPPRAGQALVINGGFSDGFGFPPSGLLTIQQRTLHTFAFITRGKSFALDGIVCQSRGGTLSLLKAKDFLRRSVNALCESALQTGPRLVSNGDNIVDPSERAGQRYRRTILGFGLDGTPHVVAFLDPVSLYVAAEFLRTAPRGTTAVAEISGSGGRFGSSFGLGLRHAINLDGDTRATIVWRGQYIAGKPDTPLPSAFVIR